MLTSLSTNKQALEVAEEGIVLLRNENNFLPLLNLGKTIKKIAVIGPNADNAHSTMGGCKQPEEEEEEKEEE